MTSAAERRPVVVGIGEVLWDVYPDGAHLGGAPANFSCHAAAVGDSQVHGIDGVA